MSEQTPYITAMEAYQRGDLVACVDILQGDEAMHDEECQVFLGSLYLEGERLSRDPQKAVSLYAAAAERTNLRATYLLGLVWFHGKGVAQDKALGVRYLKRAAFMNFPHAQFYLAGTYTKGMLRRRLSHVGVAWILVAAENGHEQARRYVESQGTPPECALALANNLQGAIQSLQLLVGLDSEAAMIRLDELAWEEWS